jgi:hypothetical protein
MERARMNGDDEDDDEDGDQYENEVKLVRYAIERLTVYPNEVAGACLRGLSPTAVDVLANAADDTLEDIAGFGSVDPLKALRFMCAAFLALRQAKRLTDTCRGPRSTTLPKRNADDPRL